MSFTISSVATTLVGGPSTTVSTFFLRFVKTLIFLYAFGLDILSAGLDTGYGISILIIFFALQYPKNGINSQSSVLTWWDNTVYTKTADYQGMPYKMIAEGETFGLSSW
jgi:hypothetical protein